MRRTFGICISIFSAAALIAEGPSWINKPPSEWAEQEATQVLADSPWSGAATVTFMAGKNEDKVREGGKWGSDRPAAPLSALGQRILSGVGGKPHVYQTPDPPPLRVVWGSALPIRAAELKLGATGTGDWDNYYVIAVFGVPSSMTDSKRDGLMHGLMQMADLRLSETKILKPARVNIVETGDSTSAVIYEFPRSQEIGTKDERVTFVAQINRLFVTRYFYPAQMMFAGKVEL